MEGDIILEDLCKQLSDHLFHNSKNPYTTVIITNSKITVTQDVLGIPVER